MNRENIVLNFVKITFLILISLFILINQGLAQNEEIFLQTGHTSSVWSVAFSPDGSKLASGSRDDTIKLWDVKSGELLKTLSGHTSVVMSVAFSPDGSKLASGSWDNTIKLWDVKSGELLKTLSDHTSGVWSVAFSPDGSKLASGSDDNTIKLWDVKSGGLLKTLSGHTFYVLSVAFSPDGSKLASGSADDTIKLWDVKSGELLIPPSGHTSDVLSVAFKPAARNPVAFSPDGSKLASGSSDYTIKLWDVKSGGLLKTLSGHTSDVQSVAFKPVAFNPVAFNPVAFSPDGSKLASGSSDYTIKLWDVKSGGLLIILSGHTSYVSSVAFSPDGSKLASGSGDDTIKLWDVKSGELLITLSDHTSRVWSVAFSPDGSKLASGSDDYTIKLWDVKSGELLKTLSGHISDVSSVAFSPDGSKLASGSRDNTIKLWDVKSGKLEWTLALLPANKWFIFSPEKLLYVSSLQGDEYAGIRFDNQLKPLYVYNIAQYYREELKRSNLRQVSTEVNVIIERKWLKKWWDNYENKGLWFSGLAILCLFTVAIVYLSRRRSDPMEVAKEFFIKAGYQKRESLSQTLILLHAEAEQKKGLVSLWEESDEVLLRSVLSHKDKFPDDLKVYLIYKNQAPSSENIQKLRKELDYEIIPIFSNIMEKALAKGDCTERLKDLEEPYIVRIDPYLESKPIYDPTWFFGRDQFLKRLPPVLMQGQHVGIFGLRKVGKTSLINLIRQRFSDIPVIYIDCQSFSEKAAVYFEEVLKELQSELESFVTAKLPPLPQAFDRESFRKHVLSLFDIWKASGRHNPFLIILDEIDKLFPSKEYVDSERILSEYINFFRVVRGLAQSHRCLVTMVVAYRPDVNRRNILGETIGENPMFKSFQEEYLGFLNAEESEALICEIGLWKKIIWSDKAARKVYHYCGGHPLITRFFASQACREGSLKSIDLERVEETGSEIEKELRRNDIGNYYKEGLWDLLHDDERQVLASICKKGNNGYLETETPVKLEDALTNLENFGLVTNYKGRLFVTAELFNVWLERRVP